MTEITMTLKTVIQHLLCLDHDNSCQNDLLQPSKMSENWG